jgi:dTDP-glucose 4,6-dehydratase
VDAAKLTANLGWSPAIPFEHGLADTVGWYRDDYAWWRRIVSGDYLLDRVAARAQINLFDAGPEG